MSSEIPEDQFNSDDCMIAVQAAHSMANKFREDVAIQSDLSVVLLRERQQPVLEIVRYDY